MLTVYEIYTKEKDGKQFLWGYVETLADAIKAIQRLNYTAYLQDNEFSYEYFEVPNVGQELSEFQFDNILVSVTIKDDTNKIKIVSNDFPKDINVDRVNQYSDRMEIVFSINLESKLSKEEIISKALKLINGGVYYEAI